MIVDRSQPHKRREKYRGTNNFIFLSPGWSIAYYRVLISRKRVHAARRQPKVQLTGSAVSISTKKIYPYFYTTSSLDLAFPSISELVLSSPRRRRPQNLSSLPQWISSFCPRPEGVDSKNPSALHIAGYPPHSMATDLISSPVGPDISRRRKENRPSEHLSTWRVMIMGQVVLRCTPKCTEQYRNPRV
jgi:hypothetical protein